MSGKQWQFIDSALGGRGLVCSRMRKATDMAGSGSSPISVVTLVLWASCLVVGVAGFSLPYSRPLPVAEKPLPAQVELLEVELTGDPASSPLNQPPSDSDLPPPPMLDAFDPPPMSPLVEVAAPDALVKFALPVEGPVRIVEAAKADYVRPRPQEQLVAAAAPPAVQTITYGQGEGRQPAPDYPRQAMRGGQEGTVTVRFSVGANGRVLSTEAVSPSPWPLLNESALRAIRERWRFPDGVVRLYEVSIHFELTR